MSKQQKETLRWLGIANQTCLSLFIMFAYHCSSCLPIIVLHVCLSLFIMFVYHCSSCLPIIVHHVCLSLLIMFVYHCSSCLSIIVLHVCLSLLFMFVYHCSSCLPIIVHRNCLSLLYWNYNWNCLSLHIKLSCLLVLTKEKWRMKLPYVLFQIWQWR